MHWENLRIGTCSWKYPSWLGLVYSAAKGIDYLEEYARTYNTVEVDQWFWSLFEGKDSRKSPPVLPNPLDVAHYGAVVPDDFRFTVKVPNSVTLTHYYRKNRQGPLIPNPHFLSDELFRDVIGRLEPIHDQLGPLMFQFEYLNKQKMDSQQAFEKRFSTFLNAIPSDYPYGLEIRNPHYLNQRFFDFLRGHAVCPVFLQGYYMPSLVDVFKRHEESILKHRSAVIRLHGPDRAGIEKMSGNVWDRILTPKNDELAAVAEMIRKMQNQGSSVYVNVNNHYEGSAPLTIQRLEKVLSGPQDIA